jgi:hypothetical protein
VSLLRTQAGGTIGSSVTSYLPLKSYVVASRLRNTANNSPDVFVLPKKKIPIVHHTIHGTYVVKIDNPHPTSC